MFEHTIIKVTSNGLKKTVIKGAMFQRNTANFLYCIIFREIQNDL